MAGNKGVIFKYDVLDFLNVGTSSNPIWALCGDGFTQIGENPNAQVDSMGFVHNRSASKIITGYEFVFPFNAISFRDERAIQRVRDVYLLQQTGNDAQTEFLRVFTWTDFTSEKVRARKFTVSIEISSISGSFSEKEALSGNFNGVGDATYCFCDLTSGKMVVTDTTVDEWDLWENVDTETIDNTFKMLFRNVMKKPVESINKSTKL